MNSAFACCSLIASGLALYLFFRLRRGLRVDESSLRQRIGALELALQRLFSELEQMKAGVREVAERAGMLVPPQPPRSGLNLSRRAQVLRLFRRGDPPEQIAASLGLPQAEVDLLLKVHRMVLQLPRQ